MAAELQVFLRFLTQDAKVPLSTAISKVKELQAADLGSAESLSKIKASDLETYFPGDDNEKTRKQIITAAKRVSKKRSSTAANDASTPKKQRKDSQPLFHENQGVLSPEELEESLSIAPYDPAASTSSIEETELHTNRAPLVLAFVLTLLKYLNPTQPLSSRLSLAQAYVSTTSRTRAVYLGLESGKSAEEEGWGEGQPSITIMGKKLAILRRWGYPPATNTTTTHDIRNEASTRTSEPAYEDEEEPPLWALDLESLKKSNTFASSTSNTTSSGPLRNNNSTYNNRNTHSNLPIYTPQSARNYLLEACEPVPLQTSNKVSSSSSSSKKQTAAERTRTKEENLSKLLYALDRVYASWSAAGLSAKELEGRTWGWYVKVRPAVAEGVAGWGGKNTLRLENVLALAHTTGIKGDDSTGIAKEEGGPDIVKREEEEGEGKGKGRNAT